MGQEMNDRRLMRDDVRAVLEGWGCHREGRLKSGGHFVRRDAAPGYDLAAAQSEYVERVRWFAAAEPALHREFVLRQLPYDLTAWHGEYLPALIQKDREGTFRRLGWWALLDAQGYDADRYLPLERVVAIVRRVFLEALGERLEEAPFALPPDWRVPLGPDALEMGSAAAGELRALEDARRRRGTMRVV